MEKESKGKYMFLANDCTIFFVCSATSFNDKDNICDDNIDSVQIMKKRSFSDFSLVMAKGRLWMQNSVQTNSFCTNKYGLADAVSKMMSDVEVYKSLGHTNNVIFKNRFSRLGKSFSS
jgi:hypothetical protein